MAETANRPGDHLSAGPDGQFVGFEHLARRRTGLRCHPPDEPWVGELAPWQARDRLGCMGVQAHRALAARPDPADLVRVACIQALITNTTGILTEAAAYKGHIDVGVARRLTPSLGEASQMAWNRMAKRWAS